MSGDSGEFGGVKYSFPSRFEHEAGSNPEEFLGAAHAACFNLVVAKELSEQGNPPENLETRATVTLREDGGDFEVTAVHLALTGTVPGVDDAAFRQIAEEASENCPVSRLLKPGLETLTVEVDLQ